MSFAGRPRLFYDLPSSPRTAEAVLLISDLLMFLAPLFLVTAILERSEAREDLLLLVLWAVVPRCMSRFISQSKKMRLQLPFGSYQARMITLSNMVRPACSLNRRMKQISRFRTTSIRGSR